MACDPYWDKVVLACHFDGTNGSTTFTDVKGHTLTANGNAQLTTTDPKFGTACATFDGTGDYIVCASSADFVVGSAEFTLEGWFYFAGFATNHAYGTGLFDLRPIGSVASGFALFANSSGVLTVWDTNSAATQSASGKVSTGAWCHIAMCRTGGRMRVFVDGAVAIDYAHTINYAPTDTTIILGTVVDYQDTSVNFKHNGKIDDLRFTKAARYTANFTPDTSAFLTNQCAISGVVKDASNNLTSRLVRVFRRDIGSLIGAALSDATTGTYSIPTSYAGEHFVLAHDTNDADPYWDKVVLACHFDGVPDNGDTYRNNVVLNIRGNDGLDDTGKTLTYNGNATVSTAQKKYGSASLYFDGANDSISLADTPDLKFGTGNFTVECWLRLNALPGAQGVNIIGRGEYGTNADWHFQLNSSAQLCFYLSTAVAYVVTVSTALTTGQWYHLAVTRSGTQFYAFVDGVMTTGTTSALSTESNASGLYMIGADQASDEMMLNGYIDDLRITKGVARYTANFTPPTVEIPAIVGPMIKDSSSTAKTITRAGDVVISSTQSKFGGYSAYFDGNGDYFTTQTSSDFSYGTGDFTIEFFLRPTTSTSVILLDGRPASTDGAYVAIWLNPTNGLELYVSGAWRIRDSAAITTSVWHHVALSRSAGVTKLFLDGVSLGSWADATSYIDTRYVIGAGNNSGNNPLNGYIDDLRITKGVARYTANFTPPTQAFRETPNGGTENAVILDRIVPV